MSLSANRSEGQPAILPGRRRAPNPHVSPARHRPQHLHPTEKPTAHLQQHGQLPAQRTAQPRSKGTEEHHKRRWLKQCHGVGWSCLSSWPSPPAPGQFFFPTVPAAWPQHGQNIAASLRAPGDRGRCRVPAPPARSPRGSRCWRHPEIPDPASGPPVAKPWKIDLLLPNHGQRWREPTCSPSCSCCTPRAIRVSGRAAPERDAQRDPRGLVESLLAEVLQLELFGIKGQEGFFGLKILEHVVSSCSTSRWCLEAGE